MLKKVDFLTKVPAITLSLVSKVTATSGAL